MPYFYIIKHRYSGKKYAGIRYAKKAHPSDLLKKYFTSSRIVKSLLKEDPDCFEVEEIKVFQTKKQVIEYELEFIITNNAHLSENWYNQAAAKSINPEAVKQTCLDRYGVENWMQSDEARNKKLGFKEGNTYGCFERSNETKQRMSVAFTERVFSEEHRQKIRESRLGTKSSESARQKMSENRKGKPRPASFSEKMSVLMQGENNPMYGKVSPRKGVKDPIIVCEHCGKESNIGNYSRWHGDKCKHKYSNA